MLYLFSGLLPDVPYVATLCCSLAPLISTFRLNGLHCQLAYGFLNYSAFFFVPSLTSSRLSPISRGSKSPTLPWTSDRVRHRCDSGMDIRASFNEIVGPVSVCWTLTFSSFSEAVIVDVTGFAMLEIVTKRVIVPHHNKPSRCSNLRSTVYTRSPSLYDLVAVVRKFLTLQFLAGCPYLSHIQHCITLFSFLFSYPFLWRNFSLNRPPSPICSLCSGMCSFVTSVTLFSFHPS
jgi:hypothetical protein